MRRGGGRRWGAGQETGKKRLEGRQKEQEKLEQRTESAAAAREPPVGGDGKGNATDTSVNSGCSSVCPSLCRMSRRFTEKSPQL